MKLSLSILFTMLCFNTGMAQIVRLSGNWKFHIGDKPAWSATQFDDSDWEIITAPSAWEEEGFNGYDGFAWYRKKFDGKSLEKDGTYYLNLGFIDDADEVYVNGRLVGFSGVMPPKFKTAYNSERNYWLPNDIINFNGANTIAIRVFDVIQGGGIVEGKLGIYSKPKSKMLIDLQGLWDFRKSSDWQPLKDDKEWKKIMVPSPWEHQGYLSYDGFAWYRKSFTVDIKLIDKQEDLVLILGKIDDFDEAYLNGKQIGRTNDGKRFGRSRSFEELRAYNIPPNLLKKNGLNTIEIFVEDMGNVGGIYEGPVGIVARTTYERYFR